MKIKAKKGSRLYLLCLKSTGQPSTRVPGQAMLTDADAARLNEDVLKLASVEWQLAPDEQQPKKAGAAAALRRSAV